GGGGAAARVRRGGGALDPPPGDGDPCPDGQDVDLSLDEGPGGGNGVAGDPFDGLAYLDPSQFGVGDFGGEQEPDGGENAVTMFISVDNCVHSAIRSNTSTDDPDGWGGWGARAVGRVFPVFEVQPRRSRPAEESEPGNENDADDPPPASDSSNARNCAGYNDVLLIRTESTRLLAMQTACACDCAASAKTNSASLVDAENEAK
ncbi:hypothetical protein THAOC_06299, partial [Thalassiosira oceanica]